MEGYEALIDLLIFPGMAALIATLIVFAILILIALYVYWALVLMTLAKKLKHKDIAWLAWIPVANMFLIPILAKKHWAWGFMFLVPVANVVFYFLWTWKIFEQRKYPGWLCFIVLATAIPFIKGIALVANLVIWGIVAWSDRK